MDEPLILFFILAGFIKQVHQGHPCKQRYIKNSQHIISYAFLEKPEKDWAKMVSEAKESPLEPGLFGEMGLTFCKKEKAAFPSPPSCVS